MSKPGILFVLGLVFVRVNRLPAPIVEEPQKPTPTAEQSEAPKPAAKSRMITAANVIAAAAPQQLTAGELDEVIAAIRAGVAYVNVHTAVSPGGEIRGQLRASDRDKD